MPKTRFSDLLDKDVQEGLKAVLATMKAIVKEQKLLAKSAAKGLGGATPTSASGLKGLEKSLGDVNTLVKENIKLRKQQEVLSARLIAQGTEEAKTVANVREQLNQSNRALKNNAKRRNEAVGSLNRLRATLNEARRRWDKLSTSERENEKVGGRLNRVIQNTEAQVRKLELATGRAQRNVGNYTGALGKLKSGLASAARTAASFFGIFAAVRVIKNSIKIFQEFEKGQAVLSGVLNTSAENMKELTDNAIELGSTTAKTASEVTDLQIAFARLGFSQKEIIALTKPTISGSIALNAELGETANLVGAIVNTFDDFSATDAPLILDQLTSATQNSALEFAKLQTAIPIVSGAANAAGIPFTKLVALLGKLSDSGIDASSSATSLRNIFIESAKQGLDFTQILNEIKKSQDKLTVATDQFGKRAAVSASVLANNIDAVNELDETLQNAGGTAETVADKQLDTLDGSVKLLTSAWEGLILSLSATDGVFRGIVDGVTRTLNSLNKLFGGIEKVNKANDELLNDTTDLINESNSLVKEYERLSKETDLTAQEKLRLQNVTADLVNTFGASVAVIDEETGALKVNIEAVIQQIKIRQALQSDQAKALIGEQLALETSLKRADAAQAELDILTSQTDILDENSQLTAFQQRAVIRFTQQLGTETVSTAADLALFNEEFANLSTSEQIFVDRLERITSSIQGREFQSRRLDVVNKALLDSGIDLEALARLSLNTSDRVIKTIGKETKAQRKLRKEREKAAKQFDDEVKKLESQALKEIKIERDRRKRERQAQIDIQELDAITFEEKQAAIIAQRDFDLKNEELTKSEILLIKAEANKEILDLDKALQDDQKKLREQEKEDRDKERQEQIEATKNLAQELVRLQKDASNERIKIIDDDIKASEGRVKQLQNLANRQSEDATDNLAFEQKRQAELRAEREREIRRQKQAEIGLAVLQTFSAKIQAGDSNPLTSTIRDFTLLTQFIRQISSAFEGTEDTGANGNVDSQGGKLWVLHPNERVMTKDQNKRVGGLSNDNLADIGQAYNNGMLTTANYDSPISLHRFESNDSILEKFDSLEQAVRDSKIEIPKVTWGFDAVEGTVNQTIKTQLRTNRYHKKVGRLF